MNIICNPTDAFDIDIQSGSIKLKEYPDDLLVYFDQHGNQDLSLTEAPGSVATFMPIEPSRDNDVYLHGDATEVQYAYVGKGKELTYYKNNFTNFKDGCIRFNAKKENCANDYAYQDLGDFAGVKETGLYTIYVKTKTNGTDSLNEVSFIVEEAIDGTTEGIAILSRLINEALGELTPFYTEAFDNCLRFRTRYDFGVATDGDIEVVDDGNEDSLNLWFGKKYNPSYFCAPDVDTKIISFHEKERRNNELSIIHKTDGFIWLRMVDENNEFVLERKLCKWEWSNEKFTEFELNFDSSLTNFIVNGKVKAFFETVGENQSGEFDSIIRADRQEQYLTFVGGGDAYGFKEFDIFNKKQHCGAYEPPASVDPENYDGTSYVEYEIGSTTVYGDSELKITGSGNMLLEAFDDGAPLMLVNTDGSSIPVRASSIDEFIKLFKKVDYDPNSTLSFEAEDLVIKITYLDKDTEITGFSFNPGTEAYDQNSPYNFEDLYDWVRRQCGAPQIACELTDEQIYDALCKAVEKYNKYRNWNENLNIYNLDNVDPEDTTILRKGHSEREGNYFILPAHVSPKDIVDIFFQPRFSTCWFGAGDTFLNNVMAQTFFGLYGGIVQNSADYYIWRASCNDISNIIGTQISWRVYNNHLYITPGNLHDLDQFKVGIKYRPSLTVEEIRNSEDIKALTLAYAMRTLGLIRGSFGGSIQAGDIAIQLNAETLLSEADKLEDKTIALLKSEQKPLWIIWS